jgi:hypothetical protein
VFCITAAAGLLVACGGRSSESSDSPDDGGSSNAGQGGTAGSGAGGSANGGSGGTAGSAGGEQPPLSDCNNQLLGGTRRCTVPSAHCRGPCSNSWQADNVCQNGTWHFVGVIRCGPNAEQAPECRNASGGDLTPCCPSELDCVDKPDGYPGFSCTPGDASSCSCGCYQGRQSCEC